MIHPLSQSLHFLPSSTILHSSWVNIQNFHDIKQQGISTSTRNLKRNDRSRNNNNRNHHILMSLLDDNDGNNNSNNNSDNEMQEKEDDNNDEFLQDLLRAKSEKLGMDIPTSSQQIQESIQNSQNEFLMAMKQAKIDFKKSKDDLGVDGAIDLLKQDWDEEDRLWELQKELEFGVYDSLEDEDDDDDNQRKNAFQ